MPRLLVGVFDLLEQLHSRLARLIRKCFEKFNYYSDQILIAPLKLKSVCHIFGIFQTITNSTH